MKIVLGIFLSLLVAVPAYWKSSLSFSGLIGAVLIGAVYFGLGDPAWYGVLLAFFLSSTLLSHFRLQEKKPLEEGFEKTGKRDFGQTMANGGPGAVLVILAFLFPHLRTECYLAFLGVMATVTADTWATEIGVLSKRSPRHILTWRPVEKGRSGGVTLLGTASGAAGALFIGVAGILLDQLANGPSHVLIRSGEGAIVLLTASVSGMAGSISDSILGATLQRMNRCRTCNRQVESRLHCHRETVYARGIPWLNNDWVNALSSLIGGGAAYLLARLLVL